MAAAERHFVNGRPLLERPEGCVQALFGMGCFWGAERKFWGLDGVHVTAVGYAGGGADRPSYEQVCSGRTGHAEVVRVVYRPEIVGFHELVRVFFENHDPTQGMRQGNDVGTQYRSAIYVESEEQFSVALARRDAYAMTLAAAGHGPITTELRSHVPFFLAESYHQQYLVKNPNGYCGLRGTGVPCPAHETTDHSVKRPK